MAFSLRLPPELEANLKQLAKAHSRSMHGEMLHALAAYVEKEKGRQFMAKKLVPPFTAEEDAEDFEALVSGMVKAGMLTREQGEYGTGLENVRPDLRPIAEKELERQGK